MTAGPPCPRLLNSGRWPQQLNPANTEPTVQHCNTKRNKLTGNGYAQCWMLNVECWMLNVECWMCSIRSRSRSRSCLNLTMIWWHRFYHFVMLPISCCCWKRHSNSSLLRFDTISLPEIVSPSVSYWRSFQTPSATIQGRIEPSFDYFKYFFHNNRNNHNNRRRRLKRFKKTTTTTWSM